MAVHRHYKQQQQLNCSKKYKVLEINANLMENDFRKKINAKEEVEFHKKGN